MKKNNFIVLLIAFVTLLSSNGCVENGEGDPIRDAHFFFVFKKQGDAADFFTLHPSYSPDSIRQIITSAPGYYKIPMPQVNGLYRFEWQDVGNQTCKIDFGGGDVDTIRQDLYDKDGHLFTGYHHAVSSDVATTKIYYNNVLVETYNYLTSDIVKQLEQRNNPKVSTWSNDPLLITVNKRAER